MISRIRTVCAGVFFSAAALCAAAVPGFAGDDLSLFREIVNEHAKITSIDAEIMQIIQTGKAEREIFRGRYRADAQGRFRIDYRTPSEQIVINDGRQFYWYYPPERLLYRIERKEYAPARGGINPLGEFSAGFEKRFTVSRAGRSLYGFFRVAERFIMKDNSTGAVLEIRADSGRKVLLDKTVRDARGREILKESYEEYARVGGAQFPMRITVSALTPKGVTVNMTRYSNVTLNSGIKSSVYSIAIPGNVTRRRLYQ